MNQYPEALFFDAEGTLWYSRPPYDATDYWQDPTVAAARRVFELDAAVPGLLHELKRAGSKLILVSRHVPERLEELLAEFGLRDCFDEVHVVYDKAAAIHECLQRHGLNAHQAVMIGDTVDVDIRPVRNSGVSAILVDRHEVYLDEPCRIAQLDQTVAALTSLRHRLASQEA